MREVSSTVWLSIGDASGKFIEKIGTTSEHPFYVEGKGWTAAKEIGIGTSIVTRAGPSVRVLDVETKHEKVLVYNFTVDQTHSYFVGKSGLWVHNTDCFADQAKANDHYQRHGNDFGAQNQADYENQAMDFTTDPAPVIQEKIRPNGEIVRYDANTERFAVSRSDGTVKTIDLLHKSLV